MSKVMALSGGLLLVAGMILAQPTSYGYGKQDKEFKHLIANAEKIKPYPSSVTGDPYFKSFWVKGEITTFQGTVIYNLPLKYDVSQDQLLLLCEGDSMILPTAEIQNFALHDEQENHGFQRVTTGSGENIRYKKGFYEVLHNGRIKLFAKTTKKIKKSNGSRQLHYQSEKRYYVLTDGQFICIAPQKKKILKKLKDRKYELERYMESYQLNPENTNHLVKIVKYYESLI